jgi:hypothetical protein
MPPVMRAPSVAPSPERPVGLIGRFFLVIVIRIGIGVRIVGVEWRTNDVAITAWIGTLPVGVIAPGVTRVARISEVALIIG